MITHFFESPRQPALVAVEAARNRFAVAELRRVLGHVRARLRHREQQNQH